MDDIVTHNVIDHVMAIVKRSKQFANYKANIVASGDQRALTKMIDLLRAAGFIVWIENNGTITIERYGE